ncbi:MAG: GTPase HflX [Bacteroidetes bacterium]|nr:MAG: GTPase HflX [Bacteroidota bacterium]
MIEANQTVNSPKLRERAILAGVCRADMRFEQAKEYLDELAFLVETAGARAMRSFIQKLEKPLNATYLGKGKLEEIKVAIEETEANMLVVDDDLSPSQIRNLDKLLGVKVLDRSSLILHIFSERARTAQARIQVDLAQYQYLLPRLAGMWTHLSRQKGGIGLKGAGEKEIETDRRVIRQRINKLQKELVKIERQNLTRRKNRSDFVRVALVGYTNVGKSTLMNMLSKSAVLAEDKLFATLDTTVRKVVFSGIPFLLSDTVGFIRKLPHHLVECFKSTLAEAQESDILLHVVDAAHPQFEDHIQVVKTTLRELGIQDRSMLTVFNKIDLIDAEKRQELERSWYAKANTPVAFISASEKLNLQAFRQQLTELLVEKYTQKTHNGMPHPLLRDYRYYQLAEEWEQG